MSPSLDRRGLALGLAVALLSSLALPALAQEFLGKEGDWNVLTYVKGDTKYCYIESDPVKEEGDYSARGKPYLLVLRNPNGGDEVSATSGYPYKEGSEVEVALGALKVGFFTKGDKAWARTSEEDAQLVKAMKAGVSMTVKGTSQKGTFSLDTYSLKGFTAAYKRLNEACG